MIDHKYNVVIRNDEGITLHEENFWAQDFIDAAPIARNKATEFIYNNGEIGKTYTIFTFAMTEMNTFYITR